MKNSKISVKAAEFLVRELFDDVESAFKATWAMLKGESYLLNSGAKLFYADGSFWIGGYAADGSDVDSYTEHVLKNI